MVFINTSKLLFFVLTGLNSPGPAQLNNPNIQAQVCLQSNSPSEYTLHFSRPLHTPKFVFFLKKKTLKTWAPPRSAEKQIPNFTENVDVTNLLRRREKISDGKYPVKSSTPNPNLNQTEP